jgi:CHASE2 domain-containing sensor protein
MHWRFRNLRQRFQAGIIAIVIVLSLSLLGALQPLEKLAYQALFLARGEQSWSPSVVIVKIDDRSLDALGSFPWDRNQYVKLLKVLTEANSGVVGFDVIWSEPSAADLKLSEAISEHGKVVLACVDDVLGVSLKPVAVLDKSALHTGHIHKSVDVDGLSRSVVASVRNLPAFAIAVLESH